MRVFLILIFFLFSIITYSQVTIRAGVKQEYQQLIKTLPENVANSSTLKTIRNNSLFLTGHKTDTFNIEAFQPDTVSFAITIPLDIDSNYNTKAPVITPLKKRSANYKYWGQACNAWYNGDTLIIHSYYQKDNGDDYIIKIVGDKASAEYKHIVIDSRIGKRAAIVDVKAEVKNVTLDRLPTKERKVFYGKATIVTDRFNWESSYFRTGYRTSRLTLSFIFTSSITN